MKRISILSVTLLISLLLALPVCAAGSQAAYVTDDAELLTTEQRQELERAAKTVSETYDFGVYLITVDDFTAFTDSSDVFDGATALYKKYDLGIGDERRGVLLLLSMAERDYSIVTFSDYGNTVFDATTRESIAEDFLDDFGFDDWYDGFEDYISDCEETLEEAPEKLQAKIYFRIALIFIIPLIVAAIAVGALGKKMKSVAAASQAQVYAGNGLELTNSRDVFTHFTETRKKRESKSNSKSSGGFGGTSGKF